MMIGISLLFQSPWFKVNRDYRNSLKELEENEAVISITLDAKKEKKNQGYVHCHVTVCSAKLT